MTVLPFALLHASANPETTRVDTKLLIRLHELFKGDGYQPVRPWYYANLMHVDVSSVQRSLQHLEVLGYVERGDKCGNGNFSYRLCVPIDDRSPPPPLTNAA